ncbi:PQQ-binding-like beta-propeller repeat protein [Phaeodactylibacter xiamenensis]|uniref:outer membrane protein assembly factor BamB family protein n=1 Tax=Phaeodactylibacter xiamenensis TaxID=1524460 RepID=UPI0024A7C605|nr:PQQ-binding-like beta-propeller repeat protein [Phaeodactylibacter xiamenensis]
MKNPICYLSFLCFLVACSKPEFRKGVESYESTYFTRFDAPLYGVDFLLTDEESIIVAGAEAPYGLVNARPMVLSVNQGKEISWMTFLPGGRQNRFSSMKLSSTPESDYLLFNNAENPDNETERGLKFSTINEIGTITWSHTLYEDDRELQSSSMVQLTDGDYMVLSENAEGLSIENNLHLSRVSPEGDLIWSKLLENTTVSIAGPLLYFPGQEFLMGISEKSLGFPDVEVQLYKFDLEGNLIWQETIVESGPVYPNSARIVSVQDDEIMVSFSSGNDVVLIRMDTAGNIIWERKFEGERLDISVGGIQTLDGHYLLLANTSSYGNGEFDVMLTKVDRQGEIIWDKVYGGTESDAAFKVVEKANGDLLVLGNVKREITSLSETNLFILETDSEGNPK